MARAFVLEGGGNLGAVQVGMLAALGERGVEPDLLIGTSAGALNAAYIAGTGLTADSIEALASLWVRTRRRDVFPIDPIRQTLVLTGRRPALCSAAPLGRLIARSLPYARLQDAPIPIAVTATNVLTGQAVGLDHGDAVKAVLASAAIPAVYPVVTIDGKCLIDGGVADTGGIARAVALGADDVWVLPAGYACALRRPPTSALASALHAVSLLIHQRLMSEVATYADRVDLHVLPPLCPVSVSPIDFSRAAELIGRGRRAAQGWLADSDERLIDAEQFLYLHEHGQEHAAVPPVSRSRR
jgi:NTE family protein